jgi:hypothetical protein
MKSALQVTDSGELRIKSKLPLWAKSERAPLIPKAEMLSSNGHRNQSAGFPILSPMTTTTVVIMLPL